MNLKFIIILNLISFVSSFTPNKNVLVKSSVSSTIPNLKKRELMNQILLNSVYLSCGPLLGGYLSFFYPKVSSSSNGIIPKDKDGNDITLKQWKLDHPYPKRDLAQGLKGDPYYLIVDKEYNLKNFALNAVCTHLGCVVPWNEAEQKFMCPCHGSQYDTNGKVVRGPAPKSLALAKIDIDNDNIFLNNWQDDDFRDGSKPWWI